MFCKSLIVLLSFFILDIGDYRGRDRMVVGFTTKVLISKSGSCRGVLDTTLCLSVTCDRSVVFSRYPFGSFKLSLYYEAKGIKTVAWYRDG